MPVVEFSAQDRCDRCGAQAYALARNDFLNVSELLFCAHHLREHYDMLLDEGWAVIEDFEGLDRLQNPHHYVDVEA